MNTDDLKKLLETRTETINQDYKLTFDWEKTSKSDKAEIVKDILSFSNAPNGGRIIFGVRDGDYESIGLREKEYLSFDVTKINGFLRQYTDPLHSVSVHKVEMDKKKFVIIEVPEFSSEPIICKKDFQKHTGEIILQKGAIYYRNASAESTVINSHEDMRELLSRALKNRSDELLKSIEILLSGKKTSYSMSSAFLDSKEYAFTQVMRKINEKLKKYDMGNISIIIQPDIDLSGEISSTKQLRGRIDRSKISQRGWDFPHVQNNRNNGDLYNISNGFASFTDWSRHVESFCVFRNGLFIWKSGFWEDSQSTEMKNENLLSFTSIIFLLLECILFCNRFYDHGAVKPNIKLDISLDKCLDRLLVSLDSQVMMGNEYRCGVDSIDDIDVTFNVVESIANPKLYSGILAKRLFEFFNYDIDDKILEYTQQKFLEKRI